MTNADSQGEPVRAEASAGMPALHLAQARQRFATVCVDGFAVLFLGGVLLAMIDSMGLLPQPRYLGDPRAKEPAQAVLGSAVFAYFIVLEGKFGRTLGKLVAGTRVVNEDGGELGPGKAALRTLSRFVPFEWLSLRKGVMWHDRWTKTRVIRTR